MSKTFDIAIAGARGMVGTEILKLLLQRKFPAGRVLALGSGSDVGEFVEFGDDEPQVQELADFDFSTVQIALFALDKDSALLHVPRAAEAGCVVIDCSPAFRGEEDVPLALPGVNTEAIDGYRTRGIIASPDAGVVQMLRVLKPIYDEVGISRINVATYQSVSGNGQLAIDELMRQSIQALNGQGLDDFRIYPAPIAFNVLPQTDAMTEDGDTVEEQALLKESRKVLANADIGVSATTVRVPAFHGCSQALHIETRNPITAEQVRALLEKASGIKVRDRRQNGGYPTALVEASQSDAIFAGRIRNDSSHPLGLKLWTVADNIRVGTALNCVQIAEQLARDYL